MAQRAKVESSRMDFRIHPVIGVIGVGGPLYANSPGDITKWMAVPWQTDSASCRSGYGAEYDPYIPTFWPSRVPNHVLAMDEYEMVSNIQLSTEDRIQAFNTRSVWLRWLKGDHINQINQMVKDFGRFGIIVRKNTPDIGKGFPTAIYVESEVGFDDEQTHDVTESTGLGPMSRYTK